MSAAEVNFFNWVLGPILAAFYLTLFVTLAMLIETNSRQKRNADPSEPPSRTDWLHVCTCATGLLAIAWVLLKFGLAFLISICQ